MTPVIVSSNAAQLVGRHSLRGLNLHNPNAAVAFVQVFDAASAGSVTLGTTTPIASIPLAASSPTQVYFGTPIGTTDGVVLAVTTTVNGSTTSATAVVGTVLVD